MPLDPTTASALAEEVLTREPPLRNPSREEKRAQMNAYREERRAFWAERLGARAGGGAAPAAPPAPAMALVPGQGASTSEPFDPDAVARAARAR